MGNSVDRTEEEEEEEFDGKTSQVVWGREGVARQLHHDGESVSWKYKIVRSLKAWLKLNTKFKQ